MLLRTPVGRSINVATSRGGELLLGVASTLSVRVNTAATTIVSQNADVWTGRDVQLGDKTVSISTDTAIGHWWCVSTAAVITLILTRSGDGDQTVVRVVRSV